MSVILHLELDPEAVVYRCYGANDELLYVGCTTQLKVRLGQHRLRSEWFAQVLRVESEPPVSRSIARILERHQIYRLAPVRNRVANHRRGWDYARGGAGLTYFPERDKFASEEVAA